jgi:hypothetical protein
VLIRRDQDAARNVDDQARPALVPADARARDPVVTASSLTKRYGELVAVEELMGFPRFGGHVDVRRPLRVLP